MEESSETVFGFVTNAGKQVTQRTPIEQFTVASPFTDGRRGGIARAENTSHSCSATAAKLTPSVDASNTARRQRVVTGAKSTRLFVWRLAV